MLQDALQGLHEVPQRGGRREVREAALDVARGVVLGLRQPHIHQLHALLEGAGAVPGDEGRRERVRQDHLPLQALQGRRHLLQQAVGHEGLLPLLALPGQTHQLRLPLEVLQAQLCELIHQSLGLGCVLGLVGHHLLPDALRRFGQHRLGLLAERGHLLALLPGLLGGQHRELRGGMLREKLHESRDGLLAFLCQDERLVLLHVGPAALGLGPENTDLGRGVLQPLLQGLQLVAARLIGLGSELPHVSSSPRQGESSLAGSMLSLGDGLLEVKKCSARRIAGHVLQAG
mmetsp:Transcript_52948/g.172319  ORF Transcript_52948/g.172319 Transcript_52948/m.172319 type:complete len:288 (-) Transcript_52948:3081-3944(-)